MENVNAKEIWLNYFNNTLFEQGIINKSERDKMSYLIRNKCRTQNNSDKRYRKYTGLNSKKIIE